MTVSLKKHCFIFIRDHCFCDFTTDVFLSTLSQLLPAGKVLLMNSFSTNAQLTDKPGSWFLLAKCLKNTCG